MPGGGGVPGLDSSDGGSDAAGGGQLAGRPMTCLAWCVLCALRSRVKGACPMGSFSGIHDESLSSVLIHSGVQCRQQGLDLMSSYCLLRR